MKKRILIIFLITISACKQEKEIINPNKVWTELEIVELNTLVNEFDDILTEEFQTSSVESAYSQYSDFFLKNINSVPHFKRVESLNLKIYGMEVFDKIWISNKTPESSKEYVSLKMNSTYMTYLKKVGNSSNFIKSYTNNLEVANDIQPSVIAGFAKNIKEINLSDKNNRLIFVIHYLTLMNR